MAGHDYDKEVMISPKDRLKLGLIEQWMTTNECLIRYYNQKSYGTTGFKGPFIGNLNGLWNFIRSSMRRKEKTKCDQYNKIIRKADMDECIDLFRNLTDWMYDKKVLKWDDGQEFDRARVEVSNKHHGL